jgi:hypothetical protein
MVRAASVCALRFFQTWSQIIAVKFLSPSAANSANFIQLVTLCKSLSFHITLCDHKGLLGCYQNREFSQPYRRIKACRASRRGLAALLRWALRGAW